MIIDTLIHELAHCDVHGGGKEHGREHNDAFKVRRQELKTFYLKTFNNAFPGQGKTTHQSTSLFSTIQTANWKRTFSSSLSNTTHAFHNCQHYNCNGEDMQAKKIKWNSTPTSGQVIGGGSSAAASGASGPGNAAQKRRQQQEQQEQQLYGLKPAKVEEQPKLHHKGSNTPCSASGNSNINRGTSSLVSIPPGVGDGAKDGVGAGTGVEVGTSTSQSNGASVSTGVVADTASGAMRSANKKTSKPAVAANLAQQKQILREIQSTVQLNNRQEKEQRKFQDFSRRAVKTDSAVDGGGLCSIM